jgi:hypothetical protein
MLKGMPDVVLCINPVLSSCLVAKGKVLSKVRGCFQIPRCG